MYNSDENHTYDIVFGAEGVNHSLISVAAKPLNNNLKDNYIKYNVNIVL